MARDQELVSPAYRIPLTPESAGWIGAFVVIWGQIDYFMGVCIAALLKIDLLAAETLMQNMTTGPRLNLFYKLAKANLPEPMKCVAKDFNSDLSSLIDKRNHIMHGMWGYQTATPPQTSRSGIYYSKNPDDPLLIEELPEIIKKVSEKSHQIVAIAQHLTGFSWDHNAANPPSFFFGRDPPPGWPPESQEPPS
jgi:hypothetical protein